jgi:hypothetical protein
MENHEKEILESLTSTSGPSVVMAADPYVKINITTKSNPTKIGVIYFNLSI